MNKTKSPKRWVHTPRYLLRRHLALRVLGKMPPGRFLDIGCGRGDLMACLARIGFEGTGLEISPHVLPIAEDTVRPYGSRLRVVGEPSELDNDTFKYVFAFEVLEHIDDDLSALLRWREWVEPGGCFIISVPSRMKFWTSRDEAVGHYRRYEREDLRLLLTKAGFEIEHFWSYGFPLRVLTIPLRKQVFRENSSSDAQCTKEARTDSSALESTFQGGYTAAFRSVVVNLGAFGFHLLQLFFRNSDLGDGYFVVCRTGNNSNYHGADDFETT